MMLLSVCMLVALAIQIIVYGAIEENFSQKNKVMAWCWLMLFAIVTLLVEYQTFGKA